MVTHFGQWFLENINSRFIWLIDNICDSLIMWNVLETWKQINWILSHTYTRLRVIGLWSSGYIYICNCL